MQFEYLEGLNEREAFFSLFYEKKDFLSDLEKLARKRKVPIIRKEMVQFLQLLLQLQRPSRILEIGTAIGYSALLMSQFLSADGELYTIERNSVMWQEAKQRMEEAKEYLQQKREDRTHQAEHTENQSETWFEMQPEKIKILTGDAGEILPELEGNFDVIFLDSAKAQYINFLPHILRLLKNGGMLITDNVLQNGEIMHSKHLLIRRERTTHRRMRQYLWAISQEPTLSTRYFGLADGVTVSIKQEKEK